MSPSRMPYATVRAARSGLKILVGLMSVVGVMAPGSALAAPSSPPEGILQIYGTEDPSNSDNPVAPLVRRLLDEWLGEAGLPFTIRPISANRVSGSVKTAQGCYAAMARERAELEGLLWFGPLARTTYVAIAREGLTPAIKTLDDMRAYEVGLAVNSFIAALLDSRDVPLNRASSDLLNYRKLKRGRIDLWVVPRIAFEEYRARDPEWRPFVAWESDPVEFGLSCAPDLAEPWIAALKASLPRFLAKRRQEAPDP